MKPVAVALVALCLLSGCKSDEQRAAEWVTLCTQGEFTERQCRVLYALKESSDSAAANAAAAQSMSTMSLAISAGARR